MCSKNILPYGLKLLLLWFIDVNELNVNRIIEMLLSHMKQQVNISFPHSSPIELATWGYIPLVRIPCNCVTANIGRKLHTVYPRNKQYYWMLKLNKWLQAVGSNVVKGTQKVGTGKLKNSFSINNFCMSCLLLRPGIRDGSCEVKSLTPILFPINIFYLFDKIKHAYSKV